MKKTILFIAFLLIFTGCTSPNSVLFVGDTSFGESYGSSYYDHSLENFAQILNEADLVIANLETPLTDLEKSPYEGEKDYIHYSDPIRAVETFKAHNMYTFSLANNHSMDFGLGGLEQTLETDLEFFGTEEKPFIDKNFIIVGAYHKKIDNVNTLDVKQIQDLREKYPDKLLIVFPHWGTNYKLKSNNQTRMAHDLIDVGADLILGHGAHMMQEIEQYKGKWIVYSLGNFVFNSPGRYESKNVEPFSLIARLESETLKLYPIYTDNKITNYQSRFLTEEEFKKIVGDFEFGKDKYGWFIVLNL